MKLALIPIAALLMIPSFLTRADEIPQGYTLNRAGQVVPLAEGPILLPRTKLMRAAWLSECGRNIYPRECARIRRKDAERERMKRYAKSREKVYIVERDRDDGNSDYGKRCIGEAYTMEGSKNVIKTIAAYNAREAWRRKVRSKHGTQFQDVRYATRVNTKCWDEGMFVRCEFTARACRAG